MHGGMGASAKPYQCALQSMGADDNGVLKLSGDSQKNNSWGAMWFADLENQKSRLKPVADFRRLVVSDQVSDLI